MNRIIHSPNLILASQSISRAQILSQVGIEFIAVPSDVNEDTIKAVAKEKNWSIEQTALELAIAKAMAVTSRYQTDYIIAADQMLICEGQWFDKAKTREEAKEQLSFLRGKPHQLVSGCVLYREGKEIWSTVVITTLRCRNFSDEFIKFYMERLGDNLLRSVGCYQVEGLGAQLFESIEGDMFTIMGLPLLPLMEELRRQGILIK
ncbi:Maf family protein [Candidatus Odyssella thessalonicensis]|uniref:Maf family protein n=1 Tax=Candidatus Odyssella thessalonicensis TaxID=84647 RepID=UPI000225C203|nr:nucleoside triphosphate pyrophosphatase [Candidatus Odyssella thessalonicensis]